MTNLSRRRFFGLLGGAAATYFLPPLGGWKSDVIHSPWTTMGTIPGEVFFTIPNTPGMLWWSKDWVDPLLIEINLIKSLTSNLQPAKVVLDMKKFGTTRFTNHPTAAAQPQAAGNGM